MTNEIQILAPTGEPLTQRVEFLLLFDVQDGNPNGDPDAGNMPRVDPETNQGLVTDVCLKRKIRDYVQQRYAGEPGYDIFVQHGKALESQQRLPYERLNIKPDKKDESKIELARQWMCANFFDVRAFGAVMSTTEFNCGQVRGPVQISFARSIHPVMPSEHTITRVAFTKEAKKADKEGNTEMGRKYTIPYGLYVARGFVTPHYGRHLAQGGTGFTELDLKRLFEALVSMFDIDHSASRGMMAVRRLFVFRHESVLGNAPAHRLFDAVESPIKLRDRESNNLHSTLPRSFDYYADLIPTLEEVKARIPKGVTVEELVESAEPAIL